MYLLNKLRELQANSQQLALSTSDNLVLRQSELLSELGLYALAKRYNVENNIIKPEVLAKKCESEKDTLYFKLFSELQYYDQSLNSERFNIMDLNNRAVRLADLGLYSLAEIDYLTGLNYLSQYFSQHFNEMDVFKFGLSTLYLRNGQYEQGWQLYESRPQLKPIQQTFSSARQWNGESLVGKTLLVLHEQGIGDAFQFVRYVLELKCLGVDVILNHARPIHHFMAFNLEKYGIKSLNINGEDVEFDYYCSLMSLPYLMKMNEGNIPFKGRYLTCAIESKIIKSNKFKVGVFWSSNSEHENSERRNIPLAIFAKLFDLPNVEFHCLQKDIAEEDITLANSYANLFLYANQINDFFDTSAIIESMDLVISVDTSVAHLSASMGKETWILLNYKPDFRWLLEREDSIWYDSARLFRQDLDYRWEKVIDEVYQALKTKI